MARDYLLDTTALSDLVLEQRVIQSRLTQLLPAGRIYICPIVRGEAIYGLESMPKGRRRTALAEKIFDVLARLPSRSVPARAGDHYGLIKRQAERRGLSLTDNDLWIAATALAFDSALVTRDRDFRKIIHLSVENWS